jgi:Uma2 family endonuclease
VPINQADPILAATGSGAYHQSMEADRLRHRIAWPRRVHGVIIGKDGDAMASVTQQKVPPLENGDRLTRDEFERRYDAMPGLKKAELIEGVVYMPSPVRVDQHGEPHFNIIAWMGLYRWSTPGVRGADNSSARLDLDNMPQPDVCLFIDPTLDGQARISDDGYLEGAPELIAEIAASSVSHDLSLKFEVYRRNGVREYLVWRVQDQEIDWFVLRGRRYVPLKIDGEGLYRSRAFPGLWLDPAALIRGKPEIISAALQRGLASREHAEFVARLNAGPRP